MPVAIVLLMVYGGIIWLLRHVPFVLVFLPCALFGFIRGGMPLLHQRIVAVATIGAALLLAVLKVSLLSAMCCVSVCMLLVAAGVTYLPRLRSKPS